MLYDAKQTVCYPFIIVICYHEISETSATFVVESKPKQIAISLNLLTKTT